MSAPARSIARRFGLWLIVGGGLLLAALFATLDHLIDRELRGRFDSALVERAQAFVALLAAPRARERDLVDAWPEFAPTQHEDFYQIWDERGGTVGRAASNRGRDLARPAAPPGAQPVLFDLRLPDGHHGRGVLLATWRVDTAQPWAVVVASEREALDALERRIHRALVYGTLAALTLMFLLSFAAVRAGLAPLRRFGENAARRALAGQAEASRTDERLPRELAPIGATLDRAFAALSGALVREQRFARAVAHELRTPLAEMTTVVERLAAAPGAPDLGALRASLADMTRTVDGLIALARYEAGLETPAIEPLELAALITRLRQARAGDIAARALKVELTLPAELWVSSDAALVERILANLLGNAIDHAPVGTVIGVAAHHLGNDIELMVSNAAPALDPAEVSRLGERYFHAAAAPPDRRHAGLGLALSAAIAAQLGLALHFKLVDGVLQARLTGLAAL